MNKLFLAALIFSLLFACKKESGAGVYIRIKNNTETSFQNVNVSDVEYGETIPFSISDYKLVQEAIYAPGCTAFIKDSGFYIGTLFCGTPMPGAFEPGRYTFIIKPSVAVAGSYDIEMNKD